MEECKIVMLIVLIFESSRTYISGRAYNNTPISPGSRSENKVDNPYEKKVLVSIGSNTFFALKY